MLAALPDEGIRRLVRDIEAPTIWGSSGVISLGRTRLFAKRMRVTDREIESGNSTRNLFGLPLACSYGIGSPGSGSRRPVVSAILATNWVLEGAHAGFPLLYHHRVISLTARRPVQDDIAGLVDYWGGSRGVAQLLHARRAATHEVVMVCEHAPDVASSKLRRRPDELHRFCEQTTETFDFLRQQGFVHLDAHLGNFLDDGCRFLLTDFDLSLTSAFDLTKGERRFLSDHRSYDQAEVISATCNLVEAFYRSAPLSRRRSVQQAIDGLDELSYRVKCNLLLDHFDEISMRLSLPRQFVVFVTRYRDVALEFNRFLYRLATSRTKRVRLDHVSLEASLRRAQSGR